MPPHLPLPPGENAAALGLPARDLLRGVRRVLATPIRLLEPVGGALPDQLRDMLQDLGDRAARGARSLGAAARDRAAGGDLSPAIFDPDGSAGMERFARVAYSGLRLSLDRLGRDDLLVSETVAGLGFRAALAALPPEAGPPQKAAAIAAELMRRHCIGHAPAIGLGLDPGAEEAGRLALFALMLWLLTERAEAEPDEAMVLGLCLDVARAQAPAVHEAGAEEARLAPLLDRYARMI